MITKLTMGPILAMMFLAAGMAVPANTFAVEASEQTTLEGTVVGVQEDGITINQDEFLMKEKDISLQINAETKLEGIASLEDLNAGDDVRVQFIDLEGQKVVSSLSLVDSKLGA